ncbi:hypothetical protein C8J57DRAFT_1246232 [Mycena rebaudengoi]|nr:hypothetical protein C8J57DRAFT_1246232 [Mycena rebaudengoi]
MWDEVISKILIGVGEGLSGPIHGDGGEVTNFWSCLSETHKTTEAHALDADLSREDESGGGGCRTTVTLLVRIAIPFEAHPGQLELGFENMWPNHADKDPRSPLPLPPPPLGSVLSLLMSPRASTTSSIAKQAAAIAAAKAREEEKTYVAMKKKKKKVKQESAINVDDGPKDEEGPVGGKEDIARRRIIARRCRPSQSPSESPENRRQESYSDRPYCLGRFLVDPASFGIASFKCAVGLLAPDSLSTAVGHLTRLALELAELDLCLWPKEWFRDAICRRRCRQRRVNLGACDGATDFDDVLIVQPFGVANEGPFFVHLL